VAVHSTKVILRMMRYTMPDNDITIADIDGLLALVADCVDDDQLVDVVALALSRLDLTKGSAA